MLFHFYICQNLIICYIVIFPLRLISLVTDLYVFVWGCVCVCNSLRVTDTFPCSRLCLQTIHQLLKPQMVNGFFIVLISHFSFFWIYLTCDHFVLHWPLSYFDACGISLRVKKTTFPVRNGNTSNIVALGIWILLYLHGPCLACILVLCSWWSIQQLIYLEDFHEMSPRFWLLYINIYYLTSFAIEIRRSRLLSKEWASS